MLHPVTNRWLDSLGPRPQGVLHNATIIPANGKAYVLTAEDHASAVLANAVADESFAAYVCAAILDDMRGGPVEARYVHRQDTPLGPDHRLSVATYG